MSATTFKELEKDFKRNYKPRREIMLTIDLGNLEKFLKDKDLCAAISISPLWKRYIWELASAMAHSIRRDRTKSLDAFRSTLEVIWLEVRDVSTDDAQAIIAGIILDYFPELFTDFMLAQIEDGRIFFDTLCAEKAFIELASRGVRK